jgi:glucokinase
MPRSKDLVLAADVGGTHVRLGIVSLRPRPRILLADRSRTVEITDFPAHIREFLGRAKDDGFLVLQACLAVAGPVEERKGRRRGS